MVALSHTTSGTRQGRRRFFIFIAILMIAVVALGFGKSFYLRPAYTDKPLPAYLIVHGIVMSAWFLLFLVQASLVSAKRIDIHRRLGIVGVALAACVVATAIIVNLNVVPRMLALGQISKPEEGVPFAIASLSALPPFAILVLLAVFFRRNAGTHKRLMFWAFAWVLGPAFANTRPLGQLLDSLVAPHLPFFPADLIWLFALIAYDWTTERRLHPATYIPFALLALYFIFATPLIAGNETLQSWLLAYLQNHGHAA